MAIIILFIINQIILQLKIHLIRARVREKQRGMKVKRISQRKRLTLIKIWNKYQILFQAILHIRSIVIPLLLKIMLVCFSQARIVHNSNHHLMRLLIQIKRYSIIELIKTKNPSKSKNQIANPRKNQNKNKIKTRKLSFSLGQARGL